MRGRLTQPPLWRCIISNPAPYLERLLKYYLQRGIIEEKWIPQIKSELAEKGRVLIPKRKGVKPVPASFSIGFKLKNGKAVTVYPVTEKPWTYFVREGEPNPHKGLCMWMPEAFFETHGRDGLPLDL